jgi:predicted amidohydrolase
LKRLTVALLQLGLHPGNVAKAVDDADRHIRTAAEKGARLICLPEHWLLSTVLPLENGILRRFSKLARELDVYLNLGAYYERRETGVFLTSVMVSPQGDDFFRQDKVHLYRRENRMALSGSGFSLSSVDGFRVAVLVCHDAVFPEAARTVTKAGADLIVVPSLIKKAGMEPWLCYIRARSLENRVPLVSPNVYHPPVFLGGSRAINLKYDRGEHVMHAVEKTTRRGVTEMVVEMDLASNRALRDERLKELHPHAYNVS